MLVEHFTNEGIKIGVEQGIEQGREEGIEQTKLEIVQNLLKTSMSWAEITKVTGLSESDYRFAYKSKTSD